MRFVAICAFVSTACSDLSDVDFSPEFLRGNGSEGPRTIPLSNVGTVTWRDQLRGALWGLLVGPFVGAALGFTVGAGLPHSCGPGCNDSETQGPDTLGGLAAGTAIGLLLGPL